MVLLHSSYGARVGDQATPYDVSGLFIGNQLGNMILGTTVDAHKEWGSLGAKHPTASDKLIGTNHLDLDLESDEASSSQTIGPTMQLRLA